MGKRQDLPADDREMTDAGADLSWEPRPRIQLLQILGDDYAPSAFPCPKPGLFSWPSVE